MKNLILLFIAFLIVGCPPVVDNGDTADTDTTATDDIPADSMITDSTVTDTAITDTTITDTTATDTTTTDITDTTEVIDTTEADTTVTDTIFDPATIKEDNNKYDSKINKDKKHSYFLLHFSCPVCEGNRYTDSNFKNENGYQKLDRRCLDCNSEFKVKRKRDFYEIKPK